MAYYGGYYSPYSRYGGSPYYPPQPQQPTAPQQPSAPTPQQPPQGGTAPQPSSPMTGFGNGGVESPQAPADPGARKQFFMRQMGWGGYGGMGGGFDPYGFNPAAQYGGGRSFAQLQQMGMARPPYPGFGMFGGGFGGSPFGGFPGRQPTGPGFSPPFSPTVPWIPGLPSPQPGGGPQPQQPIPGGTPQVPIPGGGGTPAPSTPPPTGGTPQPMPNPPAPNGSPTRGQPWTPPAWAPRGVPKYTPGYGAEDLEPTLYNDFFGYQPFSPFGGSAPADFSVDRYSAVAGPSLRESADFQAPSGGALQPALEQQLLAGLQNPSAYNSDVVKGTYDMLNQQLLKGYDVQRQQLNEEMARRGLSASSVAGGRLGDLASNQARAQSDLAQGLLTQQAQTYGSDRASALNAALGYGGQQFQQGLAGFQANLGARGQNFQQDLAARAFAGDQQAQQVLNSLQRGQFGLQQQGQNFGQGLAGYQANLGANAQSFGQRNQLLANLLGYGQQAFQNQLATAQVNQNYDSQMRDFLMQILGIS